ncbi:tRNA dihydrouridine synthase DusB [Gilvimarinus sp. F26214L]|uniref:tRNA dihydrouridine synthase DusB n=1 Tax=Gilvimarinus sp. DZF01 TaxID=3461371 RepID=UPI00404624D4
MFHIGPYTISSRVLLAPMAGVSDAPFRNICREMGAGLTTSEMLTADTRLWRSRKSSLRLLDAASPPSPSHATATPPRSLQIAGSEPAAMAAAARAAADSGAELIDINMGCPAKKVCSKAAGSALLRDEKLVADILNAVVAAVNVPVTLKMRTGWCPESRNALRVSRIAEDAGIQAITLHGRTRACRFNGEAEYDTIAAVVDSVGVPVIANGDIDSPAKAERVLKRTGAQAVMIGRGAQGQPWLIRQISVHLETGCAPAAPELPQIGRILGEHLHALHEFYGDYMGVRIARKHVKWYLQRLAGRFESRANGSLVNPEADPSALKKSLQTFNSIDSPDLQLAFVQQLFERLITKEDIAA